MKSIISRLVMIALVLVGVSVMAFTIVNEEQVCPLCGETFTALLAGSGTQFDTRSDLKPMGPIIAPWPAAECPKCGFVIYKNDMTDEEKDKLRKFVATDEYKKYIKRSTYYRIAKTKEYMGDPVQSLVSSFLQASWQEEDVEEAYKEDAETVIKYIEEDLKTLSRSEQRWQTHAILKGEMLRRLGRFEEASKYLATLKEYPELKEGFVAEIVAWQIGLVDNKDSKPHNISEVNSAKLENPRDEKSEDRKLDEKKGPEVDEK